MTQPVLNYAMIPRTKRIYMGTRI